MQELVGDELEEMEERRLEIMKAAPKSEIYATKAQHDSGQIGQHVYDEQIASDGWYATKHFSLTVLLVCHFYVLSGAKLRK